MVLEDEKLVQRLDTLTEFEERLIERGFNVWTVGVTIEKNMITWGKSKKHTIIISYFIKKLPLEVESLPYEDDFSGFKASRATDFMGLAKSWNFSLLE